MSAEEVGNMTLKELRERFQKLKLHDPTKVVHAVKGHHPKQLREKCLPTGNIISSSENITLMIIGTCSL